MESNRVFYDRIARAYDLLADHDEQQAREAGEQALGLSGGERVLEIGFGTGNSAINLARLVGESGKVVGIDVSTGMRDVARAKIDKEGLGSRIELQIADARELPFDDGSFDAVFASFTLELFPGEEIPLVLAEARRVLRPGGKIGIVAMAAVKEGEHPSLLERAYIWMHRHFPHIVDCRPIDVGKVLGDADYELTDTRSLKIWTMPVSVVIGRKAA